MSLPPVTVACRCGAEFASRAKHQQSVHCPTCGRSVRVKRPGAGAAAPAVAPPPASAPRAASAPPPQIPDAPGVGDVDDEDDATYIRDEHGKLVLAEWTFDGRLVPASPVRADYGAGLAARSWIIEPHGPGVCQLVHLQPPGWSFGAEPQPCLRRASRLIPGGVICDSCYAALH